MVQGCRLADSGCHRCRHDDAIVAECDAEGRLRNLDHAGQTWGCRFRDAHSGLWALSELTRAGSHCRQDEEARVIADTASPAAFIVVGVDGSEADKDALRWAAGQARLTGAELRAVSLADTIQQRLGTSSALGERLRRILSQRCASQQNRLTAMAE